MSVPLALLELIRVLRSQLEKAHPSNSDRFRKTAWDYVQTLRTYVDAPAVINEPCVKVLTACRIYADELNVSVETGDANRTALEDAKRIALLAIDHLEEALHDAEPSETARILRLPW